jgi:hypothetical protein
LNWLGRFWQRRRIRQRQEAIHRHLGFLFQQFGGGLSRVSFENGSSQVWVEYGNVALHYWVHFQGDTGCCVAPAFDQVKLHPLEEVLQFLDSEERGKPRIQGLQSLAERLRPHAAVLNRKFSRKAYPDFRDEFDRYCSRNSEPI